jgi:site-specific recombinase XerD
LVNLAVVRPALSGQPLSPQEFDDFEQELVDQFALAAAASGITDDYITQERSVVFAFLRFLGNYVWTAAPEDVDRFLNRERKVRGLAKSTIHSKAGTLARFFDFLSARYQGEIHNLTGHVVVQPVDEFNRPAKADYGGTIRVPPSRTEVEALFMEWREALPASRKYLPAARDYLAASLWRRVGLRINETVMLDIRDWRPDLGERGKLHVRFGKGSMGRGPKTRMVPAINGIDDLLNWWLIDVRHQFGDDWNDPDAPLLPSERRDPELGRNRRAGDDALRSGFAKAVNTWLPEWSGRLTPHGMRHFCASSMYERGLDLKAIQDLLGHEWLSTTTRYIHVHDNHVEAAWAVANDRVAQRWGTGTR